nr:hypothetical protein [Tanacetum cinerariifolium]
LESDSGEDAPRWIRKLRPSFSQPKISVYPEVCNPKDPWSFKEEILLEDAIAANISRAEKKRSVGWCTVSTGLVSPTTPGLTASRISTYHCSLRSCHPAGGCGHTDRDN